MQRTAFEIFLKRSFSIIRVGPLALFVNLNRLELSYRFQTLHDDSLRIRKRSNFIIVTRKSLIFSFLTKNLCMLILSDSSDFLNADSYYNKVIEASVLSSPKYVSMSLNSIMYLINLAKNLLTQFYLVH